MKFANWTEEGYVALKLAGEGRPQYLCLAGPYRSLNVAEDVLLNLKSLPSGLNLEAVWPDQPGVLVPRELRVKA